MRLLRRIVSGRPSLTVFVLSTSSRAATTGTLATWYRIAVALDMYLGDLVRPLHE